MKDFIYLVQGQPDLVKKYLHLGDKENADVVLLTYDKPMEGAIFFPNSTWTQGRNELLKHALSKGCYQYYIFCDDDVSFIKGGWDEFEANLIQFKPAIGVPIVPKTRELPRWSKYQIFRINDEQLVAFHHDVVMDGIVLPYQEHLDEIHCWWATCEAQEILIQNFYYKQALQFNDIEISNDCTGRYDIAPGLDTFRKETRNWLSQQFKNRYRDISNAKLDVILDLPVVLFLDLPVILFWTLIFKIKSRFVKKTPNYSIKKNVCSKKLRNDSAIFKQYLEHIKKHSNGG